MAEYPFRHLSIRVPWHDAGWAGVVCKAPLLNGACAKLKRISEDKNEQEELPFSGKNLDEISREQWPCCVEERATFMAPLEMELLKRHALAEMSPSHYGHFKSTPQWYPACSMGIVPFRWMICQEDHRRVMRRVREE